MDRYVLRGYEDSMDNSSSCSIDKLFELLNMYGVHYQENFGRDMRARLSSNEKDDGGIIGAVVVDSQSGDFLSNGSIVYNKSSGATRVGLLGAVITRQDHRRRGLSTKVTTKILKDFDGKIGSFLVLGTGSPGAAKLYRRLGFEHLNGGLDRMNKRGYNPEDRGEWIMIRKPPNAAAERSAASLLKSYYYSASEDPNDFAMQALRRHHWAELVLLFNVQDSDFRKLPVLGIDDGVGAEEAMLRVINRVESRRQRSMRTDASNVYVCVDRKHCRVHAICVLNTICKCDAKACCCGSSYSLPFSKGASICIDRFLSSRCARRRRRRRLLFASGVCAVGALFLLLRPRQAPLSERPMRSL